MKTIKQFLGYCHSRQTNSLANEVLTIYFDNDGTHRTGHIIQSYFIVQKFLIEFPSAKSEILMYPDDEAFELQNSTMLNQWLQFLATHEGEVDEELGFSFPSMIKNLPVRLGGMITTGGGWGYPLKITLPLVARFL